MNTCFYCGCKLTKAGHKTHSQTRDHVAPRSRGGKGLKNNTVYACKGCNASKGNLLLEEFRLVVAYRLGLVSEVIYPFPGEIEEK